MATNKKAVKPISKKPASKGPAKKTTPDKHRNIKSVKQQPKVKKAANTTKLYLKRRLPKMPVKLLRKQLNLLKISHRQKNLLNRSLKKQHPSKKLFLLKKLLNQLLNP